MTIRKEILQGSHLEHFKSAKELALLLPLGHPRRVMIEKEVNTIAEQLSK